MRLKTSDKDLELRSLEKKDAKPLFQVTDQNRERLRTWLPWVDVTRKPSDTLAWIVAKQKEKPWEQGAVFGIWHLDRIIGTISLFEVAKVHKRAEIGYWIASSHEGKGLMSEACRTLVNFAFKKEGFNKLMICCGEQNKKSAAVAKRLGFKKEGRLRQDRWLHGRCIDRLIFGMLASEWKRGETTKKRGE